MLGGRHRLGKVKGMKVFLDFEASSLSDQSYPVEVAWVFEDGYAESHLIKPAPEWIEWDPRAEAIHGISRARLVHEGETHTSVATRMIEVLSEHELFASAPSWDGKWLSVLLRGGRAAPPCPAAPRHGRRPASHGHGNPPDRRPSRPAGGRGRRPRRGRQCGEKQHSGSPRAGRCHG